MIYIIIPVFNRKSFTHACLTSLQKQMEREFIIIVVDHGSEDGTSSMIKNDFPEVILVQGDKSMWWSEATNLGVAEAMRRASGSSGNFILTLNNDLEVEPDYLSNLVKEAKENNNAIIGSICVNIENKQEVVCAGQKWNAITAKHRTTIDINKPYSTIPRTKMMETDLLTGRGTLIPMECFNKIGLYNNKYFPHYAADNDFSLRAKKAGYNILVSPNAVTYSHVDARGLKDVNYESNWKRLNDFFFSLKSYGNIKVRWHWAIVHTKVPVIYFMIDYSRIIAGAIIRNLKAIITASSSKPI